MKISCIIPAYNEASRISPILEVVTKHPLIEEVIVINDASADTTSDIVRLFTSVKLIEHQHNKGKSNAIYTGLHASTGEFLLFVDADLIGLDEKNSQILLHLLQVNKLK